MNESCESDEGLHKLPSKSVSSKSNFTREESKKKFGKEDDIGTFATSVELIQIQSNLSNKKSSMGVKENDISNFNSINSFNNFNNLDVTNPDESNIRDKQDGEGINNVF